MPYQDYPDGMYLVKKRSPEKTVDHYAILIIGRRLKQFRIDGRHPVLFHQSPPRLRVDYFQNTGEWQVLGKIVDEGAAILRMTNVAAYKPDYLLLANNCEQVARYVASGRHESTQVQGWMILGGLALVAVAAFSR